MVKNLPANARDIRDAGWIPGSGRSLGEGNGYPTPASLPGESYGPRSLAGYGPWGRKESDTTEHTHTLHHYPQLTGEKLRHRQMTTWTNFASYPEPKPDPNTSRLCSRLI